MTSPFPLSSLAPDLLGHITDLLSGFDIASLYFTGALALVHRLQAPGAVRTFRLVVRHPRQVGFPHLALRFRYLLEFSLLHTEDMKHIPVDDTCISKLPATLRRLRLYFLNSFACLHDVPLPSPPSLPPSGSMSYAILPLNTLFPSLEVLEYMPQKLQFIRTFDSLPASLTCLNAGKNVGLSSLVLLPRHLTKLTVSFAPSQDWNVDKVSFPGSLVDLTAFDVSSCEMIRFLPPTLDFLLIYYNTTPNSAWRRADHETFGAKWLPRTLKSLTVSGSHQLRLTVPFTRALPRTLQHLVVSCEKTTSASAADAILNLPPHLNSVQIHGLFMNISSTPISRESPVYNATKHLIQHINTELPYSTLWMFLVQDNLPLLPPALQHLTTGTLYPELVASLPRSLTHLQVERLVLGTSSRTEHAHHRLPSSTSESSESSEKKVEHIVCETCLATEANRESSKDGKDKDTLDSKLWLFPPSLTLLHVQYPSITRAFNWALAQCTKLQTLKLPQPNWHDIDPNLVSNHPTLRSIRCHPDVNDAHVALPILPPMKQLDTVLLLRIEPPSAQSIASFYNSLPSHSLTKLHLDIPKDFGFHASDVEIVLTGDKLPHLESLFVGYVQHLTNAMVSHLPRQLTALSVMGTNSTINDEALATFPKSLTYVSLSCKDVSLDGICLLPNLSIFTIFPYGEFPAWDEYYQRRATRFAERYGNIVHPIDYDDY